MKKTRIIVGLSLCGWALVSLVWIVCLGIRTNRLCRQVADLQGDLQYWSNRQINSSIYLAHKLDVYDKVLWPSDDNYIPDAEQRDSMKVWQERFANGQ